MAPSTTTDTGRPESAQIPAWRYVSVDPVLESDDTRPRVRISPLDLLGDLLDDAGVQPTAHGPEIPESVLMDTGVILSQSVIPFIRRRFQAAISIAWVDVSPNTYPLDDFRLTAEHWKIARERESKRGSDVWE